MPSFYQPRLFPDMVDQTPAAWINDILLLKFLLIYLIFTI